MHPFIISGGTNTECYYFKHINNLTEYKFNIRPEYFGDESNYTEIFPKRIKAILAKNANAKIFCVFDWDTIFEDEEKLKKHKIFVENIHKEVATNNVFICTSMPCIEYWFLLHFEDYKSLLKNYAKVSNRLGCFKEKIFPDSSKKLHDLLKSEKYLKDSTWVKNLCSDGKLETAIKRAEDNINAMENGNSDIQSYSYVYKVFKKE